MLRFIPKPEKNEVICIRIDSEKLKFIDNVASKSKMSRNKFLCQCIDFALQNLESNTE